jgi:hypothetical protein
MAHYLFNLLPRDTRGVAGQRALAAELVAAGLWGVGADEAHGDGLAPGDEVLLYLGAPARVFVGRAQLASAVHAWTPAEAPAVPDGSPRGVVLAGVETWDPPVPMDAVLARIDPAQDARADFVAGVVRIAAVEYRAALEAAGVR